MSFPPYTFNAPYLWPYYYQQPSIASLTPKQHLLPASLNAGSGTEHIRFDAEDPSWYPGLSTVRVNSAPSSSLFVYNTLPPVMPYGVYTPPFHRLSDSALAQATWGTYPAWAVYPQSSLPSPPAMFNPLLDGEALGGSLLLFDLSSSTFDPRQISHYSSTEGVALSHEELTQTATSPWVTRMVIECDELLPQWTLTLAHRQDKFPNKNSYLGVLPNNMRAADEPQAITVSDVLHAIYRMLHRQVTQREWHETPQDKVTSVARAYTRRCRAVSSVQAFEESQGVRRVDFLLDHYMFRGLVRRQGEQGFEHVRLRVGKR